jgi:crotonobetainyl-CoA:carnitine CoA-transferase CaiB-like acyl-CoA transferase
VSPKFSRTPARVRTPAARIGEHNDAIYGGLLGYTAERITALREAGVI